MKIFDCFMYFDEEVILDLRLNILNNYVDYFVIVESTYTHKGESRKLKFDHQKFKKFEKKIIYLTYDYVPKNIEKIFEKDNEDIKSKKYILNGYKRDHFQRNYISNGIKEANQDDIIIISDIDEIPNLEKLDLTKIQDDLILFNQKMCYYKFNLYQKNYNWTGSRACKKKNLLSPQWIRDVKPKKYSKWRLDTYFSKHKYTNIHLINNGGWHFSYLNTPELIEQKLKSYTHHREYELNPIGIENIEERIRNRMSVYNLSTDKRENQFAKGVKLEIIDDKDLPSYINQNLKKYQEWLA